MDGVLPRASIPRLVPLVLRNLLCWLLAALTLLASAPAQRSAACGTDAQPGACQPSTSCCCPQDEAEQQAEEAESCCSCKAPSRAPTPAPDQDHGKQTFAATHEPARGPPSVAHGNEEPRGNPGPTAPAQRGHAPLPNVARQIAYSVWRL